MTNVEGTSAVRARVVDRVPLLFRQNVEAMFVNHLRNHIGKHPEVAVLVLTRHRFVLFSDTADVRFGMDPFQWLEPNIKHIGNELMVGTEVGRDRKRWLRWVGNKVKECYQAKVQRTTILKDIEGLQKLCNPGSGVAGSATAVSKLLAVLNHELLEVLNVTGQNKNCNFGVFSNVIFQMINKHGFHILSEQKWNSVYDTRTNCTGSFYICHK